MRKIAFVLLLVGCGHQAAAPPVCPTAPLPNVPVEGPTSYEHLTHEQLARKLMEMTGAEQLSHQVLESMLENFRKMPNLPPEFLDEFQRRAKPQTLVDLIVPVYVKHYDRDTLIAVIKF